MSDQTGLTYKDAGVDIDAGNALVDAIKPHAKRTKRAGVMDGLGGFGAFFDLKAAGYNDPILVSGTDGVGTKLKVAILANKHDTVGIDLVAMCVNDLVVQGAEPLLFLDYYATGKLDVDAGRDIIAGIAEGCHQAGAALIGGETAEMPGMYREGDYDLAGFCVGAVERGDELTGKEVEEGDIVLGLASSGLHSNGFSLVRRVIEASGTAYDAPAPFAEGQTVAQALLAPTKIYVKSTLAAIRHGGVSALAHITGGGLVENLPRVMPEGLGVDLDAARWSLPPVFSWLGKAGGIQDSELARTFNCGIGMCVIVKADRAAELKVVLSEHGEEVVEIGTIVARAPEEECVMIDGLDTWAS